MTPKSRAQEALKAAQHWAVFGLGIVPTDEIQTAVRDALDLAAALERVPERLRSKTLYERVDGTWSFAATDNRRTKYRIPPIGGIGPTPAAAILAAVEKMEKRS